MRRLRAISWHDPGANITRRLIDNSGEFCFFVMALRLLQFLLRVAFIQLSND